MLLARVPAVAFLATALVLVGCPSGGAPSGGATGGGDANRGRALFESKGCGACHTFSGIAGTGGTIGPNLDGIGARAATRKSGASAEAYIRESIENPTAFVVEGFPSPSTMPSGQAAGQDLADLVAFLLTK